MRILVAFLCSVVIDLGRGRNVPDPDKHCSALSPPANGRMVEKDADRMYGMVFFECIDGYELIGTPVRVCQTDTTWTGSQPICKPSSECVCVPALRDPENGKAASPANPKAGDKATFSCDAGYELDGPELIECGEDCKWKQQFPKCTTVQCRRLRPPDNGDLEYSKEAINIGVTARYLCDPGFKLVGPGVRTCEDDGSWSGNSPSCEKIDYCADKPCANGGSCEAQGMGFICSCAGGYRGDKCQDRVQCQVAEAPKDGFKMESGHGNNVGTVVIFGCNKGFTLVGSDKRTCQATGEWDGTPATCQKIDNCGNNPCENGGTCENAAQVEVGYTCKCLDGFTGDRCQQKLSACDRNPCQNEGVCHNIGENDFSCSCTEDYAGRLCEMKLLPCDRHPCLHGGSCINTQTGGFVCKCIEEYRGERCETKYNPCVSQPCLHDGRCLVGDYPDGFICDCPKGYEGHRCDYNVDFCVNNPCLNRGMCKSGFDGYTCVCQSGFAGDTCSIVVDHCGPGACSNGGICQNGEDSFLCSCKPGFSGQHCENGFDCPDEYGLFPDPADCTHFYHCSHRQAYHKPCPAGLQFSPRLLTCDWPNESGCKT